jgi:hypothetical protein
VLTRRPPKAREASSTSAMMAAERSSSADASPQASTPLAYIEPSVSPAPRLSSSASAASVAIAAGSPCQSSTTARRVRASASCWWRWVRAPHVETEDSGFVYYTRYFTGPALPARLGPPLVPIGTISVVTIDGDSDTWSVTIPRLPEMRR